MKERSGKVERKLVLAVIGGGDASRETRKLAYELGCAIAKSGAVLINGGGRGVMEFAAKGAREKGGHTIGILKDYDHKANDYVEFVIATGIGHARNAVIVASADAVIAIAGEAGTLSEIGLAMKLGKTIVALDSWPEIKGLKHAKKPADAVSMALKLIAETETGTTDDGYRRSARTYRRD